ncbi:MAG: hypothetical protein FGM24_05910 [Candidatus Kapabacteria bacterium]|nr:hypothetical protein [Candidatus Kapabacteria bacterium]
MTPDTYIVTAVLLGLSLLIAMVRWPKVWIVTFLLSLPLFLTDTGTGINAREVALGSFFSGTVILWMIWSVGRPDRVLIRHWFDFLLLLYVILTGCNIVIALLNNVDPIEWAADFSVVCLMLYYFPIREYFTQEEDLKLLLIVAAISSIGMAGFTVYMYKQRMQDNGLMYAYQLVSSRSVTLAAVHLLGVLFAIAGLFYSTFRVRVLLLITAAVNAGALFLSFGRTLWVFFFVGVAMLMFFLRARQSVALATGLVAAGVLAVAVAFKVNPRLAEIGTRVVTHRFTSSAQLSGGDLSFETRIIEAEAALRHIKRYPLGGKGLRHPFISYHPIEQGHHNTSFVHIGYIGIAMRQGIPMLILMMVILVMSTIMCWKGARQLPSTGPYRLYKLVSIVMLINMPALFGNIFMAGIFDQRYGNVMFAVIFACTGIATEMLHRRTTAVTPDAPVLP